MVEPLIKDAFLLCFVYELLMIFELKLELFLRKSILIWKNIHSQDVLKGLDSTKFLEILYSNKTPNKFSNHQLKIAFKHPNFVREPF